MFVADVKTVNPTIARVVSPINRFVLDNWLRRYLLCGVLRFWCLTDFFLAMLFLFLLWFLTLLWLLNRRTHYGALPVFQLNRSRLPLGEKRIPHVDAVRRLTLTTM